MKAHGFIFARGGSKGLPRKNVKLLCGKPLLQYSIETAQQTSGLDKTFVSTEDAEIAEVAKSAGAIVIPRPKELATDTSPEWLAWQHAVAWVKEKYGDFQGFVSLPATSPLRSSGDVLAALTKLRDMDADICIAVTQSARNPYFNMVKMDENGLVSLLASKKGKVTRRQDAPDVYDITTVVYATTVEYILNNNGVLDGRVASVLVPKERAVDIDDIHDFRLAEAILRLEGQDEC